MIYLDNAATTYPKPEDVYNIMDEYNRFKAVNAGRGSYKAARELSTLISETKNLLRKLVSVDINASVVLSPSITIALNQVLNGLEMNKNTTVYISPYEHNAVARTIHAIQKKIGINVKELPIDNATLEINLDKMRLEFSNDKPSIVVCTHISNVTGYILPIKNIFEEAKKYDAVTVLDTAQSLGLIPVNASYLHADIVAFAGHKSLYGPFGIGGFINVNNIPLNEYITGGTGSDSLNLEMPDGGESKYESASSNIVAIAGLNAAIKSLNQESIFKEEKVLTEYAISRLEKNNNIKMYLPENKDNHIGIISFTYKGLSSDEVGMILDEDFDIAVRTGYHCAPFIHDYLNDKKSLGTVRIGLSQFTTKNDIDKLADALLELEM
ncbi:aminotransferase class V-fold PLP-dependent enzyme [Pseudobutyrivibrio sp.]|uniref:aminotransferase class V-fold PLP-dependent enzyme n=1 Tax=Pseudobutyrivibrio sp. TaxID=2014367 RepID=UPI003864E32A